MKRERRYSPNFYVRVSVFAVVGPRDIRAREIAATENCAPWKDQERIIRFLCYRLRRFARAGGFGPLRNVQITVFEAYDMGPASRGLTPKQS